MRLSELPTAELVNLVEKLRRGGFKIGVGQHVSAQRLLLTLAAEECPDAELRSLRRWLSPVLCSSPQEQDAFRRYFNEWAEERFGLSLPDEEGKPEVGRDSGGGRAAGPSRLLAPRHLYAAAVMLLLLLASAPFLYHRVRGTSPPNPITGAPTSDTSASVGATDRGSGTARNNPVSGEFPRDDASSNNFTQEPQPAPEPPTTASPARRALKKIKSNWLYSATICAAILLACAWALWQLYFRLTLRKWRSSRNASFESLEIEGASDLIFQDPGFRRMAQEFRRPRPVESNDLDLPQTITATVNNGGWFKPVSGPRKSTPEYLVLMDRASLRDQRARFEDEMVARLLEHSIYIERYYFHRDPRVCRKEELGALPLQYSLQDLAGRHPHHYLMIFSEGTGLIDPRTGRPQRWLNVFSHWAMRGLLTHEFSSTAGYLERALANTGFIVVPSSRDGIECFLENISTVVKSREPASVGGQAIPAMLLKRPERWLGSERPEEGVLTQLRDRLRAFLGQSGYDWLIACAFYPALQWELTLFWGRALGIKDAFEETLWKLVRLPWFRYGSMPDWLRVELIAELPPAKEQNIRRLLEKLLISALSNPDIPVSLEIATETEESDGKGGLRRSLKSGWDNLIAGKLLRRFLNTLPEESRLNDLVFLSVMSGGKLTVDVPRRLYSKLLQGKRPRGSIRHRMLLRAAGATAYEEDNHYKRGFLGSAYPRSLFFKGFSPRGKFRWPLLAALLLACASVAFLSLWSRPVKDTGPYFGVVAPPGGQVLRYSTGIADPESLDPQLSLGQPEEQIYMALYDGLAEYHPKTMEPIPSIATRWTISADASEYVFFLRRDAKFSNGDPIKASDFVYTFRRGLRPELASRAAWLAYDIKYAEAYNEGGAFVRDPATGRFVLASEAEPQFTGEGDTGGPRLAIRVELAPETEFHKFIRSPERLVVPSDEKERQKAFNNNPKLASLITGKELVPIRAEDIGVEAVDDYTLRVTLRQPAPYFIGLIPAPFFRVLHQRSIEQHVVNAFTQPNMVNSGAFKLSEYRPGEQIVVARNPFYWDAAHTGLDKIYFLLGEDSTDILDAYREGNSDVTGRVVPLANLAYFKTREDFIQHPYLGIAYLAINVKKPPTDDLRVRRAFNLAIDKNALAASRGMYPLTSFVPGRVFHGYPLPKGDSFDVEAAKRLLAEAGYRDASGEFDPSKFPADQVELTFITAESNLKVAEFVQAQWKQNLGITIPLRNVEWKTFLNQRSTLQYKGFALAGWVGDYMDPYTYLSLFTTVAGDNATGWYDVKYLQMLGEAERVPDQAKRYDMLAHAEAYLLDQQPVVPLLVMSANTLKKPYVKGLYPNPIMMYPWKYVYIEHDSSKWGPDVTETDDMLPP